MFLILWFFVILCYVFTRLTLGVSKSSTCLVGKTALITGANSGIGYQTALNLASRGCRVIMADVVDQENSKNNIIKYTGNSKIVAKYLDLASLKSVREFAEDILQSEEELHFLVNNAGIGASSQKETEDGLGPVMQINYFGHFLLTHLLIELLKKAAPSRIVFTSSIAAFIHNLTLSNLRSELPPTNILNLTLSYGSSKFAMVIASDLFAQKLKGAQVGSNAVYPGVVNTNLFSHMFSQCNSSIIQFILKIVCLFFSKNIWEGAQTTTHCIVSKNLENVTGRFFVDCRSFSKPLKAFNGDFCKEVWRVSEEAVGLTANEKLRVNKKLFKAN